MLSFPDKEENILEKRDKQLQCSLIPKQVSKPKDIFFLRGDLFIDLNSYEDCKVSN